MRIALLFSVLFKWVEYIALMLGLYGFHLSIKIVLVYRKKKSKEASIIKFGTGHSDKGRIGAVFFERMRIGMGVLKWGFVAFFQKKLHP
jgi:hypothetical protein